MKKLIMAFFLLLTVASWAQTAWTVETVPNTRLQGNEIHVSDPDGYLSDSSERRINTALGSIREQADVFVVTLSSIGSAEPKRFATTLFNRWGIGDAEADNGVLLLFVEDQHALEFETGYGAETILTDAKCERIFTKTIVPFFKKGDYEAGLCAGVAEIVNVYGGMVPDGLKAATIDKENESKDALGIADEIGVSRYTLVFFLFIALLPMLGFIYWLIKLSMKEKSAKKLYNGTEEGGIMYIDATGKEWTGSPWGGMGCCGGLLIGLSIFLCSIIAVLVVLAAFPNVHGSAKEYCWIGFTLVLYLTFVSFCHNRRLMRISKMMARKSLRPKEVYQTAMKHATNQIAIWMAPWIGFIYFLKLKKRISQAPEAQCPACGAAMQKDGRFALPGIHQTEERVEALHFKPYRCDYGHEYVLKEKGKHYADFTTCLKCGAFANKRTETRMVSKADYKHDGEKIETYVCQHCGETTTKTVVIPRLVYVSSGGGSSSGSSGRSYSSHRSSGGSFGGGRSGGGGFSGRW